MTTRVESSSVLVSQERLTALVQQWREQAQRWRDDEETPYACEWADTQDQCADDLEQILLSTVPRAQEHEQEQEARVDAGQPSANSPTGSTAASSQTDSGLTQSYDCEILRSVGWR